jgi:lipopolysaccharide biosynthesis protein
MSDYPVNPQTRIFDFDKFWRFIPLSRPKKELLKYLLFTTLPFLFRDWAVYQNWKDARVFLPPKNWHFFLSFWKDHCITNYPFRITSGLKNESDKKVLAVVIHVFYTEVFKEILHYLECSNYSLIKLYITTIPQLSESVNKAASCSSFQYSLMIVDNRGRDILPFLKILPEVFCNEHEFILKVHTKKSNHLQKRELWKHDLFEKLMGNNHLIKNVKTIQSSEKIGIVGPSGHILPLMFYYGGNSSNVLHLTKKLGVDSKKLAGLHFVAGSMFFARKESLIPILRLKLSDEDFEPESGQKDGTMAHAVERAFSVALISSNLELVDTEFNIQEPFLRITNDHRFTF